MKTELKPCPFCGSAAYAWSWNYGTAIQCSMFNNKSHLIQVRAETREKAAELWNGRHKNEDNENS